MFELMATCRAGLRARYAEAHRREDGQAHVDALLRGLQDLQGHVANPHVLELAIWTMTRCTIRRRKTTRGAAQDCCGRR